MGASVSCVVNGLPRYVGETVIVIYKNRDVGNWEIEEKVVGEEGLIELDGPGPDENQQYWIGKKYMSEVKTFPIRQPGVLNKTGRGTDVDVYLEASHGGQVEIGNEKGSHLEDITYDSDDRFSGKKRIRVSTDYGEEMYVRVLSDDLEPLNLLALDVNYRQYER